MAEARRLCFLLTTDYCLLLRFRFDPAAFFGGAVGWTFVPVSSPGPASAGVRLSSMVGLGEAIACCPCGRASVFCGGVGAGLVASVTGSVSPPAASQAAQPPSR